LIEKTEMRKMIKRLKQGRAMWYACDQDFGRKNSVFAPFFGHQAATIATIGRLVKITGAKVVFIDYFRDDSQGFAKSHYHVNISDPFTDQFNASDLDNAIVMNQAVEASVRQHKSQYFWVHKRFKKRPKHETKNFY
jgi:KDO2-lipid IV(A) lauroyltransferase